MLLSDLRSGRLHHGTLRLSRGRPRGLVARGPLCPVAFTTARHPTAVWDVVFSDGPSPRRATCFGAPLESSAAYMVTDRVSGRPVENGSNEVRGGRMVMPVIARASVTCGR
ncbi:hypothetical protein GCM10023196_059440 [Actinoallomurus vinaceus]|uniref:Uncharacterized protein n=1 Tax=Actinoallomurus vinaceus TaxID=1080074 RepID=A0ABP8UHC9_9ACTN